MTDKCRNGAIFRVLQFREPQCPNLTSRHVWCPAGPFIVWALQPLVFGTVFVGSYYQALPACTYGTDLEKPLHTVLRWLVVQESIDQTFACACLSTSLLHFLDFIFGIPSKEHSMGTYHSWIFLHLCAAAHKNAGYTWGLTINPDPPPPPPQAVQEKTHALTPVPCTGKSTIFESGFFALFCGGTHFGALAISARTNRAA